MSSNQSDCKWLLVEWKNGGRNVVYIRSVVSPLNKELKSGDVLTVYRYGNQETATLVARSRGREFLETMIKAPDREEEAGPSVKYEEEAKDFSSSASSWVPSDDCGAQSGDSAEVENKKVKSETGKRKYYNRRFSKKIITPSHRATPVIPKIMQQSNNKTMMNRKRAHNDSLDLSRNISIDKSIPDSTKRNNLQNDTGIKYVKVDVREIFEMRDNCEVLVEMMNYFKHYQYLKINNRLLEHVPYPLKVEDMNQTPNNQTVDEDVREKEQENSEEFNRSNDNVLITNKYNNMAVKMAQNNGAAMDEWVRIGSGKTVIHRDQYKRVNWKSYTIATRTLLLAVFPRRTLATHSLTGKKSPAFQNKPAKMCLDPKKISDVIMEIMDRFHVRENLVRSIITTKCADECKMWKTRVNKMKSKKNNENIPPPPPSSNNNLEEQRVI